MGRFTVAVMAVLLGASGVAHASGRHEKWESVEKLTPGLPVEVEMEHGKREECRLISVDDATLTCGREPDPDVDWGPGANARVVFPREAVLAVWVWEPVPDRHIGLWIAGAVGFALGGAVCSVGGPGPIVACGAGGALIVMAIVADAGRGVAPYPPVWLPLPPPPPPTYPQRERKWRRKLWYHAPVSQPVP